MLIERYDAVVVYLYARVQDLPRSHGRFRDKMLDTLLRIPGEIYLVVKLGQANKVNTLDSSLAELRWMLRFAAAPSNRLITTRQQAVAERLIAEVGALIHTRSPRR